MHNDDKADLARFLAGDQTAFKRIHERNHGYIIGLTFRILRNYSDAEEVTSISFTVAAREAPRFRGDCAVRTWLHQIAHRRSLNLLRNRRVRRVEKSDSIDEDLGEGITLAHKLTDHRNPAGDLVFNETETRVASAIKLLPPLFQEVVIMRGAKEMDYEEIAQKLQINVGTVKSRLSRARQKLKEAIAA